jgi:AbiU2
MAGIFQAIRPHSRAEFDSVIEHVTHEAYRARCHWDVLAAMEEAFDEYALEFNQTPWFWELTRRALQDDLILRLARLYDPHGAATSLGNLLQTLKANVSHAGTLFPPDITTLDVADLEADLVSVSVQDTVIAKLLKVRHEYVAHRGTHHVKKGTFTTVPRLAEHELNGLVHKPINLLAKYRRHLGYPLISWGDHEVDDLRQLLNLVRAASA